MGEKSQAPDRRAGPGQQVTRLESTWFLACVGLIALHVVDDRYLQPEEGISAGDHLVSGIVPLLLLLAAALGYHRMRAGWRALTALAVGSFGLGTGAEAAFYTFTVGASGDDYTSWLTVPAALGLLGLAAVVAWRSRKRDDSSTLRLVLRRLGLTIGVVALMFLALQPLTESYVLTHVINAEVPEPDFGHDYEDVTFTTGDGLRLHGWYVPSENGAAVIVFPGRTGRDDHVSMLADQGYGVLVFDRRGEGLSDGEPNLLGWGGDEDLKAAAEYLASRPDVEPGRIGGIGLSVGGELLIEAAAESDSFAAIVSEGAGARSVRDVWDRPAAQHPGPGGRGVPDRVAAGVRRAGAAAGDLHEPGLLRGCRRAEGALGGPRVGPHRRDRRTAGGVRAPLDRVLRPPSRSRLINHRPSRF
jgi:hypothetical protein